MLASHQQGRREGVPQRVEGKALVRKPGAFEERLVLPVVEVVVVGRPADMVGEDEIGVTPRAGPHPFFILTQPVGTQGRHGGFVEWHGAAAGLVLRVSEV